MNGSEQVPSANYLRSHSKISHYVLVRFKLENQKVTSVASVRATDIAELKHPSTAANGFATAERLAIVRLYDLQENCWWGAPYVAQGQQDPVSKAEIRLLCYET